MGFDMGLESSRAMSHAYNPASVVDNSDEPKRIAPYGTWESEITKDAVFSSSRVLLSPRFDRRTGRAFCCELRADGNNHLIELRDGDCIDILPEDFSAKSRVYEYGGGPYAILPGNRVIFSNFKDRSLYILDVDGGNVQSLLASETLRYGDLEAHPGDEPWVLAVQEDHEIDIPEKVKNYVVAINTDSGEVRRIVEGADFYMFPTFSPDGKKVSWVEWSFPGMPWAGVSLYWADWAEGEVKSDTVEHIAGNESSTVTEPRWGPDGYLYFAEEQTNYYQLFRRKPSDTESTAIILPGLETVEFGSAKFACGSHTYTLLSEKTLVASVTDNGSDKLISVDLDTLTYKQLDLPFVSVLYDGVERSSDDSFLLVANSHTSPDVLCEVQLCGDDVQYTTLRTSTDIKYPSSVFSKPEPIRFPAKNGHDRDVVGFFWPPHNSNFQAPEGEKPPLIIQSHGGPTGHTPPALMLSLQYWNARGYATFAINYSGSTGYGKSYRELLNGKWGEIDVDDVAESVQYLVDSGRVDGSRVGIRGGSAGGYMVLQALCTYPDIFAGGVCLFGISEVKLLLETTHKMESRYADMLLFTKDMTEEDRQKVMKDRSPVYHAGNITAPLLILHGEEDKVVPISQADTMYDDMTKRGRDVKLVRFPGEGHGFRSGANRFKSHEEEELWWRKTLVKS
ncbi:putative Alpha/Beta hydrolase protein [Seiridium unicorne]|uniref:Alpha/Beta hydrolase protein n=1 Tax=Seiridium unicorne TaxID=138068 RepID=A0ABR2UNE3_9PEZI